MEMEGSYKCYNELIVWFVVRLVVLILYVLLQADVYRLCLAQVGDNP